MHCQCTHCQHLHQVTAFDLAQCKAQVRCGHCGSVFDALARLGDGPPGASAPPPIFPSQRPPVLGAAPEIDMDDDDDPVLDEELPDFAVDPGPPLPVEPVPKRRRWPWIMASAVLLAGLGAQFVIYEREQILNNPAWRQTVDQVCQALPVDCRLPLMTATDQIELVSRDIRPHPSVERALIINATLKNAASFAQAFPRVRIRLSDLDGQVVAARQFDPAEYLDDATVISDGLKAGTLLPMVFEIVDPGPTAVAFEFEFMPPPAP